MECESPHATGDYADKLSHALKMLRIPPEIAKPYRNEETLTVAKSFQSSSSLVLNTIINLIPGISQWIIHEELMKDTLFTLATFASPDEDVYEKPLWTTDELQRLANIAIDTLVLQVYSFESDAKKAREQIVSHHMKNTLLSIHTNLKRGTRGAFDERVYGADPHDTSYDIPYAFQLTWILKQINLEQQCQVVMPCILTALDHYSPPIKRQGLLSSLIVAQKTNGSDLALYKDVLLDAVCFNIAGSEELWSLVVKTAVNLVTLIEHGNSRSPWYRKILIEMFGEIERHQDDKSRINTWIEQVKPQFKQMGLVLVTHFKRLFNLLFYWLSLGDNTTSLEVLSCLAVIITHTWPRIPYHANRIWGEMVKLYQDKESDAEIHAAVLETASLLVQCCGLSVVEQHEEKHDLLPLIQALKAVYVSKPLEYVLC